MAKIKGTGRGFDAVFADNSKEESNDSVKTLRLSEIEPEPTQPRTIFNHEPLEELASSIATHGLLQPIIVREGKNGYYRIVAGERRWRASKMAGLSEIPAVILDGDDLKAAQIAVIENVQREDLNPVEEAFAYDALIERFGLTQEQVAKQVGKSRSAITNCLRLLDLPDEVLDLLKRGELSAGHARALLTLEDDKAKIELAKLVIKEDISVRETERLARKQIKTEPTGKKTKKRNPYYDEVELALSDVLQRKVRVTKSTKKGAIEIEFFDDEDLKKLIKIFDNE